MSQNWRQQMPSIDAYWMDKVLFDVHHREGHLARYRNDPEAYMQDIPLAPQLKHMIRDNQIGPMFLAGVNPYLLRAHCLGLNISEAHFVSSLSAVAKEAGYG